MNYGLYLSASGVLTNLYRQDVFANNLANVETAGFQRDVPTIAQRESQAVEAGLSTPFRQMLLDRIGGGALAGPQRIAFTQGKLNQSNNPLDVALETKETFLAVQAEDPATGEKGVRLTRDGRLSRNATGVLVNSGSGFPVLDTSDQPIQLRSDATATIDRTGRVIQNGEVVGQLQVTGVNSTAALRKLGNNLFAWEGQDPRVANKNATVRSGYVEASSVDPVRAMMDLMNASGAVNTNATVIRYHDQLMDRAVNTLGRLA